MIDFVQRKDLDGFGWQLIGEFVCTNKRYLKHDMPDLELKAVRLWANGREFAMSLESVPMDCRLQWEVAAAEAYDDMLRIEDMDQ